jgi:cytochrome c biogenesis protein
MRTALLLLFLLALASVPGSFLPQRTLNPVEVQAYFAAHPTLAPLLDRLALFDVFASPWFAAIYLLLFVSLIGCLSSRLRLHARRCARRRPDVPAVLAKLPATSGGRRRRTRPPSSPTRAARCAARAGASSPATCPAAGRACRPRRATCARRATCSSTSAWCCCSSAWRLGGLFGFKGTVLVKEGDGFANTILAYDDINPGRSSTPTARAVQLRPRRLPGHLRRRRQGADLQRRARYADDLGEPTTPYDIRVNHPLDVGGAKAYLLGHGYAPKVVVTDVEGNRLEQTVVCLPQGATFLSTCVIKVPDAAGEQLAFEGVFTPTTVQDPETGRVTSVYPAPENPALTVLGYRGDLGLDSGVPQSVYQLEDRSQLRPIGDGATPVKLAEGETWDLPGGGSLTFVETTEWATFQVTQDPGTLVALVAGTGMVVGLCLSLFVRRRRLWLRAARRGTRQAPTPLTAVP